MFRIYGERCSGTTFLTNLIKENFKGKIINQKRKKKKNTIYRYDWKHGLIYNKKPTIDIIIIRDLESWLASFYNKQWHHIEKTNIKSFLTDKIEISKNPKKIVGKLEIDYMSKKNTNWEDKDKTIFELRYYKFNALKEFYDKHPNTVMVSLHYLKNNDNCINFLKNINEKFNLNKVSNYKILDTYKGKSNTSKSTCRQYNIDLSDYKQIIHENKIIEIEEFVNNLTFIINLPEKNQIIKTN